MSDFTADKAREMAGIPSEETVGKMVDDAIAGIKNAARDRRREIILRGEFWERGGYDTRPSWKAACEALEKRGFEVKFHYVERQFVDMGTLIKW